LVIAILSIESTGMPEQVYPDADWLGARLRFYGRLVGLVIAVLLTFMVLVSVALAERGPVMALCCAIGRWRSHRLLARYGFVECPDATALPAGFCVPTFVTEHLADDEQLVIETIYTGTVNDVPVLLVIHQPAQGRDTFFQFKHSHASWFTEGYAAYQEPSQLDDTISFEATSGIGGNYFAMEELAPFLAWLTKLSGKPRATRP
jgi:hypothetical protein